MKRILSDFAYGDGPAAACYWGPTTVPLSRTPKAQGEIRKKIAIVGAGFTGLSAALHLAQAGADVAVLEAETPGWGASARNGGFCCLGGTALPHAMIRKRHGDDGLRHWCATELSAIRLVRRLLDTHKIVADTHSDGETILAHSPRAMRHLRAEQAELESVYNVQTTLHEPESLPALGMKGRYFGALTLPHGFGLNPRKYADGLATAAFQAGAAIHAHSPVLSVTRSGGSYVLKTPAARIRADQVIFATNGYSSEDVPDWLRGRFLPLQSNVLVTRPLTDQEIADGWSSAQMAYTHQTLLHYFRLMPDGRFLFGMRGGLFSGPRAFATLQQRTRRQFEQAFPFWKHVATPHSWNGALAFTAKLSPYVGPVPEMPGAFAGFAYHGNGVAMGTHAGQLLARLALAQDSGPHYPAMLQTIPKRFPLGRHRRLLMAPGYIAAAISGR
ncbi:FAD-binding oxidoreductase [Thalassovita sp.]|uniref:NAD(P)/FAD-dependent oxidoreductase n=1 Tax=Thalassovita sp. TaxID=1979401 RepID=UPI0029DE521B|nr:FAD-binding oxidoreductase [Thalassovita sp.]